MSTIKQSVIDELEESIKEAVDKLESLRLEYDQYYRPHLKLHNEAQDLLFVHDPRVITIARNVAVVKFVTACIKHAGLHTELFTTISILVRKIYIYKMTIEYLNQELLDTRQEDTQSLEILANEIAENKNRFKQIQAVISEKIHGINLGITDNQIVDYLTTVDLDNPVDDHRFNRYINILPSILLGKKLGVGDVETLSWFYNRVKESEYKYKVLLKKLDVG